MDYKDAIEYLRQHDIKKEDGTHYEFGDVSRPGTCFSLQKAVCDADARDLIFLDRLP